MSVTVTRKGSIEARVWKFGEADSVGDRITRDSIVGDITKPVPMRVNHDKSYAIGEWTKIEVRDDGIYATGKIDLTTVSGRAAYALLRTGIIKSVSLGGMAVNINRTLHVHELREISLVSPPARAAHPAARILVVKALAPSAAALAGVINRAAQRHFH